LLEEFSYNCQIIQGGRCSLGSLFIEFRDPLFGVIVFFVLVFVIAFFSYWWGRYKKREDYRYLDRFLRQFKSMPKESALSELINGEVVSDRSWLLMAHAHYQNGDYEKSISIYRALVERYEDPQQKRDVLFLLGQTYFKAGFLGRAESVLLQILRQFPRTPQALRCLVLVYEQLRQYDKALDVLDPLCELGQENTLDRLYLECIALMRNTSMDSVSKAKKLIAIHKEHHVLTYFIFEYLFTHHPDLAWKNLDLTRAERLCDIFWGLPKEKCDLDIISNNGYLRELFSARGLVKLAQSSSIFEFDVLIKLCQSGQAGATLQFEYLCSECKQVYPFVFHRCPHCSALDSVVIESILTKDFIEENHSFQ